MSIRGMLQSSVRRHSRRASTIRILSTSNESNTNLSSYIRSAHCTEVFRSTYYKASRAVITITPGDLDDIIVSEKVRPSILLGCFETLGSGLGTAARFAPTQFTSALTKIVDDAASQQFNDSIREISSMGSEANDDVKETIKYHRDLAPNTPLDLGESGNSKFDETTFVLATGLSNILNLTRSY
jgi:Ubiquinone biosynthesis protein COQ7